MLSKPVAGATNLGATSVAATRQVIQIDNTSLQQTMQVRKHNSAAEPVDITGSCVPGQWAMWNGACDDRGRFGRAGVGHDKG